MESKRYRMRNSIVFDMNLSDSKYKMNCINKIFQKENPTSKDVAHALLIILYLLYQFRGYNMRNFGDIEVFGTGTYNPWHNGLRKHLKSSYEYRIEILKGNSVKILISYFCKEYNTPISIHGQFCFNNRKSSLDAEKFFIGNENEYEARNVIISGCSPRCVKLMMDNIKNLMFPILDSEKFKNSVPIQ